MARGPGKYDHLATTVREIAKARGVVVIVCAGAAGHGFSVQADAQFTASLPAILREVAAQIEADMEGGDGR